MVKEVNILRLYALKEDKPQNNLGYSCTNRKTRAYKLHIEIIQPITDKTKIRETTKR